MKKQSSISRLQSVERAITLLKTLGNAASDLGVTDLSQRLGLPKSTVHRLLTALERGGLVEQNPTTEKYRLGVDLVRLAGRVLMRMDLLQVAQPHLHALAQACEETVNLSILTDDGKVINIARCPSPRMVRNVGWLGREMFPHSVSSGKALLAYLPEQQVERILNAGLPRFTGKTITDPTHLKNELAHVRQQGYAVAQEELEEGLSAVAAPIMNYEGHVIAAISVSGPSFRLTEERLVELAEMTRDAAKAVSHQLGWVGEE
ncbi:MAG TPA: IclR family transcriptional regulator [Thermoflexia bacterium]|nr:MAG: IclR family transcriptional regulator [Chloroflexota bacterium]HEY68214.1 IclR family transcriptional regulator [Thermoflexia bacterium]